ncbi:MAG: thioredoxin family protein [Thermoplasmata archaeon]|nr:thioredoxin family protein [Thermoplasmata archaeon]
MKIEVLGGGCARCRRLKENVKKALDELGIVAEVEEVKDVERISDYGVMMTPALVIDGEVVSEGKVPGVTEIRAVLEEKGR